MDKTERLTALIEETQRIADQQFELRELYNERAVRTIEFFVAIGTLVVTFTSFLVNSEFVSWEQIVDYVIGNYYFGASILFLVFAFLSLLWSYSHIRRYSLDSSALKTLASENQPEAVQRHVLSYYDDMISKNRARNIKQGKRLYLAIVGLVFGFLLFLLSIADYALSLLATSPLADEIVLVARLSRVTLDQELPVIGTFALIAVLLVSETFREVLDTYTIELLPLAKCHSPVKLGRQTNTDALCLRSNEKYEIEVVGGDERPHQLIIEDEDGQILTSSDDVVREGSRTSIKFKTPSKPTTLRFYCYYHPTQNGPVRVLPKKRKR